MKFGNLSIALWNVRMEKNTENYLGALRLDPTQSIEISDR